MVMPYYERIAHTADLAIRVWGPDVSTLFANAARALFDMMAEPPAGEVVARRITVESVDQEALLVDWLNALIYLHEVDGETYTRFDITALSATRLHAVAHGGPTTCRTRGIKAATFHELVMMHTPEGVEARVVFDV